MGSKIEDPNHMTSTSKFIMSIRVSSNLQLFLLLCTTYLLLAIINLYVLVDDDLYYTLSYKSKSYQFISDILEQEKRGRWLALFLLPFIILFKIFTTSGCLFIGGYVVNVNLNFSNLFRIAIISQCVFLIRPIIKLFWFTSFNVNSTLEQLHSFSPFSIFSIIDKSTIEPWLIYPFQSLNIFELLFWCALGHQLKYVLNTDFLGSLKFVAISYGVGFFFWLVFIMFITVSNS